jgi:hypothetical protein
MRNSDTTAAQAAQARADFVRVSNEISRVRRIQDALTGGLPSRPKIPVMARILSASVYNRYMIECAPAPSRK